jgi:DNA-binding MarR family transcriptional regulator
VSGRTRPAPAFPHEPRPWATALGRDAGFLFSRIGARAEKLFSTALEPLGLRPKHYSVLHYLSTVEGATQRSIVDGLWIDSSTMVTLIDDFERLGLAERRPRPGDRRAYSVYLTPRGRRVLARARKLAGEVEEQILAPFDEDERTTLRELLVRASGSEPTPEPSQNGGQSPNMRTAAREEEEIVR